MAALSVAEQVAGMREAWPGMGLAYQAAWGAGWVGTLKPYDREYRVRIDFYLGLTIGNCDLVNWGAEVRVLEPDLLAECAPGKPPHLYPSERHATLCLFDPAAGDWDFAMLLAATTVPWTAHWLAFYELWRATRRWTGPERHPEGRLASRLLSGHRPDPCRRPPALPPPRLVRRVASATGTEASGPLLRAAGAGRRPSAAVDWLPVLPPPLPATAGDIGTTSRTGGPP